MIYRVVYTHWFRHEMDEKWDFHENRMDFNTEDEARLLLMQVLENHRNTDAKLIKVNPDTKREQLLPLHIAE